jgi:hypothetical protein
MNFRRSAGLRLGIPELAPCLRRSFSVSPYWFQAPLGSSLPYSHTPVFYSSYWPILSAGGVESVTYGRIDTIFPKSPSSAKNPRSDQYPCGFYDFSKITFFNHSKKTFFVIGQITQKPATKTKTKGNSRNRPKKLEKAYEQGLVLTMMTVCFVWIADEARRGLGGNAMIASEQTVGTRPLQTFHDDTEFAGINLTNHSRR